MNPSPDASRRREDGLAIFSAAVAAVDPFVLVRANLHLGDGDLRVGPHTIPLTDTGRVIVVGAGKATPAMARAVEHALGDRIHCGSINTKHGHAVALTRITTVECSHPIPDADGVAGARGILQLLQGLTQQDVVLCLFSGGGSALMPMPAPGLSLDHKGRTTAALLACGATIDEINAIRKHLSGIKGGWLARRAMPARVVSLMMSDVINDPVDTIASGPTAADPTTFADCLKIVARYGIAGVIPAEVMHHLETGASGQLPETPKPGDPAFERTTNLVIGNNTLALAAAQSEAARRGYQPLILSSRIAGETRHIASMHVAIAREVAATGQPLPPPACLISGGETTVTLKGNGKGGRNQEFVLAAALDLVGCDGITVLSCGTDGTDGPTDAAGAIADGSSVARAACAGLQASEYLLCNDSYRFFAQLDDLVITGPTGTNVMDLRLLLVG
ncbi:MAG: glycerate kinase [bacterium]|nr:glycerate kinase [bacterium]